MKPMMPVTLITEAADDDAEIIFGTVIDEEMGDAIKVTVIATGLGGQERVTSSSLKKNSLQPSAKQSTSSHTLMKEPSERKSLKDIIEENSIANPYISDEQKQDPKPSTAPSKAQSIAEKIGFFNFDTESSVQDALEGNPPSPKMKPALDQLELSNLDEDELDTPSYLRKQKIEDGKPKDPNRQEL